MTAPVAGHPLLLGEGKRPGEKSPLPEGARGTRAGEGRTPKPLSPNYVILIRLLEPRVALPARTATYQATATRCHCTRGQVRCMLSVGQGFEKESLVTIHNPRGHCIFHRATQERQGERLGSSFRQDLCSFESSELSLDVKRTRGTESAGQKLAGDTAGWFF